ncbi:hypothetical protein [Shimia thalassica]|uniref:hypothetical protein n=1 Tax=Shimia thalassica TaxID=1715693 RepID=UPI0026E308E5|nr:hypothetical protein [Shimia thalassica]MDO6478865.1 hypothetical protein [Shimia thalassica]
MTWLFDHPVRVGWACTIGIAGFAVWLGLTPYCEDEICQRKFSTLISSRPNEIGDTLAGFAGALAFVWIIVTVWLQSKELAAQREELKLARKEAARTANALNTQADLLGKQSEIFSEEQNQRQQLLSDEYAEELLEELFHLLGQNEIRNLVWSFTDPHKPVPLDKDYEVKLMPSYSASDDLVWRMQVVQRDLKSAIEKIRTGLNAGHKTSFPTEKENYERIADIVKELKAVIEGCTEKYKSKLRRMRIPETVAHIDSIKNDNDFWD